MFKVFLAVGGALLFGLQEDLLMANSRNQVCVYFGECEIVGGVFRGFAVHSGRVTARAASMRSRSQTRYRILRLMKE
jgi:hypothetical protein